MKSPRGTQFGIWATSPHNLVQSLDHLGHLFRAGLGDLLADPLHREGADLAGDGHGDDRAGAGFARQRRLLRQESGFRFKCIIETMKSLSLVK